MQVTKLIRFLSITNLSLRFFIVVSSFLQFNPFRKIFSIILRFLGSQIFTVGLSLAALSAATLEVMEDARPGGHHGAVFLAVNELLELLAASGLARGRFLKAIENHAFRLVLVASATILAAIEAAGSVGKFGAHHGVLVLGLSKTLRCIGLLRDELKEKEE